MPNFDPNVAIERSQQNRSTLGGNPLADELARLIQPPAPRRSTLRPSRVMPPRTVPLFQGVPVLDKIGRQVATATDLKNDRAVQKAAEDEAKRQEIEAARTSPVHDRLRETPGTLDRNMMLLDQHFGNDPSYRANRDAIKYRIQGFMPSFDEGKFSPSDSIQVAESFLRPSKSVASPAQSNATGGVRQGVPEGQTVDALLNTFIEPLRNAPATPDWSGPLGDASHALLPGVQGSREAGKKLGWAIHGALNNFNIPANIVGLNDLRNVLADESKPVTKETFIGKEPSDQERFIYELAGGLASGGLAALGRNAAKGAATRLGSSLAKIGQFEGEAASANLARGIETPSTPAVVESAEVAPLRTAVIDAPESPAIHGDQHVQARVVKSRKRLKDAIETEKAPPEIAPEVKQAVSPPTGKLAGIRLGESKAQHPKGGEWHPMETRVVELDDLKVSHDHSTFQEDPTYPQQLQPRDRTNTGLREQVLENAGKLNKNDEITHDFYSTEKGAPIVGSDAVVEAGNGRVMAIRTARDMGNDAYKTYQEKVRAMHPEAANMRDPVLVRVRTSPLDMEGRAKFAAEANGRAAAAYTRVEAAVSESANLDGATIDNLVDVGKDINDALRSPQNGPAVQKFIESLDPSEARAIIGDDVTLYGRMRNAVLARVLGKESGDVLSRIVQDGDLKRISSGIERSAIPMLKTIRLIEAGTVPEALDFRSTLGEALRIVDDYRSSDNKAGFWHQGRLDPPDPNAMKVAKALVDAPSQGAVQDVLTRIAERISGASDGGLFNDGPPPAQSLGEVLGDLPDPTTPRMERVPAGVGGGRMGREAGAIDTKTLAVAGGVLGLGVLSQTPVGQQWLRENGTSGALATAGALGLFGLVYAKTRRGLPVTNSTFDVAAVALDPRTLAERAMSSGEKGIGTFGEAVDAVLDARADATYHTAEAMRAVGEHGAESFGTQKFLSSAIFKDWNGKVRDILESNVSEGKPWSEGLPQEWVSFVGKVKGELDGLLDSAEKAGIRIAVENDGTQSGKLQPGASVRLPGGRMGRYLRSEPFETPAKTGDSDVNPFTSESDVNYVNTRATRAAQNEVAKVDSKENLFFETIDADGNPATVKLGPGERFGRPVDRLGESFVPRFFKGEFADSLRNLPAQPTEYREALKDMLVQRNPHLGLSGDEMIGQLGDLAGSLDGTDGDIASFLANLEKERTWELAKFEWTDSKGNLHVVDPYEADYIRAVSRYIDRGRKRIAIAEQLGPDPQAIGNMVRILEPGHREYVEKLIGRTLGLGPRKPAENALRGLARTEGAYQTLSKLTAGTTQVSQVNDALYSLTVAGGRKVLGALYDLTLNPDRAAIRRTADIMSAAHSQWLMDLKMGGEFDWTSSVPQKVRKGVGQIRGGETSMGAATLADAVMTGVGIRWLDGNMKRMAAITGLRDAQATLELASRSKGKVPEPIARKLAFYGIDDLVPVATKIGAEKAIQANPERVAAAVRSKLTYSGAPEDFPLWMSSEVGSVVTRFKKPAYVSTKMLLGHVVDEASKGNIRPLVRFIGYGVVVGEASGYAKDLVRLDGMDSETRKLWGEGKYKDAIGRFLGKPAEKRIGFSLASALRDKAKSKTLFDLMSMATHSIYDAGGLGLPGDVMPGLNRRVSDLTGNPAPNPWEAAMPVSISEVQEALKRFAGADQRAKRYKESVSTPAANPTLERAAGEYRNMEVSAAAFEQLRTSFSLARRVTDLLDIKPDLVRVRELERKDPGSMSVSDMAELARTKARVLGRFNSLSQEVQEAKGTEPSLKREVFGAAGISDAGTPLRRKSYRK